MNYGKYTWDIEAEIYFLTPEEGGRKAPLFSGYRGQVYYDGHDWDGIEIYAEECAYWRFWTYYAKRYERR